MQFLKFQGLKHAIDIVRVLTQKEMKVKYKSSVLGYFWSVGHPLAFALVFFISFKVVMKIQVENYTVFLISALFPWQWFSNSVNSAPLVFIGNASLIKKVSFPRSSLPFTQVLIDMIHFILAIPVITFFLLLYRIYPSTAWLYGIPFLLITQFLMVYGFSLMISSANLFFRDLERLTVILTTLLFYFTPIFYPVSMVPDKYQFLIKLNPLAVLIVSWRDLFLNGHLNFMFLLLGFGYSLVIALVGYAVYKRLAWKFAEVL